MKKIYVNFRILQIIVLVACLFSLNMRAQLTTQTFSYTGTIQTFSVPQLCVSTITIEARGAGGGSTSVGCTSNGGLGARMRGEFNVVAGQQILILVGQVGQTNGSDGGGGGGSFVTTSGSVALVVAGGGGGATNDINRCGSSINPNRHGLDATITTTAANSANGLALGGNSGNGGAGAGGGGGGGFVTNGTPNPGTGGKSFMNGGAGSQGGSGAFGGYGGGGGGFGTGGNGGGGGGYSGGGTSISTTPYTGGGGGGSFNSGFNQVNTAGFQSGNGLVIISYNAGTPITASASPSNICSGQSTNLTATGVSSYTWNNGSNASGITVSPTVSTVYTVQGTSAVGCSSGYTVAVTVFSTVPTPTIISTATAVCLNKPVTLTAIGATTYTWTSPVVNGAPFIPSSTNGYTVTAGNACGTSEASITINVNPLPGITASINTPTVCSGSNIILNGGGSVSGYTWTAGAFNNVAFVPNTTTNYTVTGAAANGCTSTAVVGVTVLITPTITPVVSPTVICIGSTATLSATGATGYTWTPGTNPNTFSIAVSPTGPTTYSVTRTNGACASTSTVFLMVNPIPGMNATGTPNQICPGTGVNLNVIGAITYTWLPGGFTSSNFTVFPNNSICYTVTGSNGSCTATSPVCVTVNPVPVIAISTASTTICEGTAITLNTSGATNFTWSPSGNTNNSTENVTLPVTSIISVSGSNAFGCSATANQLIVVNPRPNVTITSNPAFICANQVANVSVPGAPNIAYSWSSGPTTPTIVVNPPVTTNYAVTATNAITQCTNSNTYTLSVFISTFVVTSPTAVCLGQPAIMSANGPATTYSWSSGPTTISPSAPSVTVTPLLNTTYTVTGITGSCSNATVIPVIVNPLPNVTASVAKPTICRFETATITGTGATTYSWNTTATTPVLTFTLSNTTNYTLTGTDANNCSKTTTITQFVATCIGIDQPEINGNNSLNVYPNPNNGKFTISSDITITLSIVNALGQVIETVDVPATKSEVSVNYLPAGIYFITGQANGLKVNKKLIVEK